MSNTAGEMVKSDAQPCEMARGVTQQFEISRSDHPSFDMTRYVSQSSDMVRGTYQTFDVNKGPHQPYEMARGVGHTFEMPRNVAPPYDMPRTIPQSFDMSRGLHHSFDMPRGVAQQYDMSRSIGQPFEMARSNTTYEMPRGPQGYEMTRDSHTPYEMPRTQPYEMARSVAPTIDMARGSMDVCHPFDYVKTYQQCPDSQAAGPAKADVTHHMPDTQQELEIPLEMPKTAPQSTVKAKSGAQKGISHPFDFAKGYAQQLEVAKRAAQNAIQAKMQAQKVEKARQEAEQAEKAKQQAEEAEKTKQQAEKIENAKAAAPPSEILKLYAQQLEMMKNSAKPSEIAKMYAKQLEMAKANTSKSEKTRKSGPYSERSRKGKGTTLSVGKENGTTRSSGKSGSASRSSSRDAQSSGKSEEMDTDESNDNQTDETKGDPPPFEMAKYLAQLSKMTKGGAPPGEKDDSQSSEGGRSDSQQSNTADTVSGETVPSSTEVAKPSGLPFPFELMKNFGLPFGMSIPGIGSPRAKRDRQELTIANKAKLIEQVEARGAKKKADIAREWGLRPSTLSTIMKNKDRIMTQFKSQRYAAGRRRMRTAAYPDVEEALLTWFRYARAANIPITGPVLQGMGVTLAQELGHPEFSCSVGWLDRFKARHGLSFNPKNNQDSGGGTFNEPADRQPSPLPSVPLEAGSDSETSPSSWFPPSMPATEISATESADSSTNAWFSNALPNVNVASTAETQDPLNKWFPETVVGEHEEPSASIPVEDLTSTWFYSTVPSLLKDYKPRDIFSASEAALFYNLLPDKSLAMKGEDGHKWTWVKERLTLMVAVNMDGSEKLPLVVIGQMKDPRAFHNVETLPLPYEANDSAMMTSSIFESWVRKLDEQYQNLNRNIVILVDTCPAHPNIDNLRCVQLAFLPKETTSPLLPVEQGIVQSLKTLYRRYILERMIKCNEKGQKYEVTVLKAMELLDEAWKQVKTELIVNSFKQVGLEQIEELYDAKLDCEDEHALLKRARRSGIDIPGDVTFESYLNVDSRVQTTMEQNKDGTEAEKAMRDDSTEASSLAGPILPSEAMQALATLRKFIQQQSGPDIFIEPLTELESWVAEHIVKPEVSFTSE